MNDAKKDLENFKEFIDTISKLTQFACAEEKCDKTCSEPKEARSCNQSNPVQFIISLNGELHRIEGETWDVQNDRLEIYNKDGLIAIFNKCDFVQIIRKP